MKNFATAPEDVQSARTELGISRKQMAEELRMTSRNLIHWETRGLPEHGTGGPHYWMTIKRLREAREKTVGVPDFVIEHKGTTTFFHAKTPRALEAVRFGTFRSYANDNCLRVPCGPELNEHWWPEPQHWEIVHEILEGEGYRCVFESGAP